MSYKILYPYDSILLRDYLVVGDLHIGYELDLVENNLYFPQYNFELIKRRLEEIKNFYNVNKIIINGDLKHKFSKHTKYGWKLIEKFINYLRENFEEVIVIKGNHDTYLKKFIEVYDYLEIGKYFITHGHKLYETDNNKKIIINHEHPSISIYINNVKYKFKVFLEGKKILVLPSFSDLFLGNPLNEIPKEEFLSPYLKKYDINELDVIFENGKRIKFSKLYMHPLNLV